MSFYAFHSLNHYGLSFLKSNFLFHLFFSVLPSDLKLFVLKIFTCIILTVCSCRVTYAFQTESTLYSCLNVKKLFAQSRHKIWSLSDCNWIRTHNHLVRKRKLNHFAKLAKWLSCVVSTCLYSAFDCMLSCRIHVSEWIHFL